MSHEWNDGRVTKTPEELLEFHQRRLIETIDFDNLQVYHQERIAHLGQYATVHELIQPLPNNVIYIDFRGGDAAA